MEGQTQELSESRSPHIIGRDELAKTPRIINHPDGTTESVSSYEEEVKAKQRWREERAN